jgi:hypothetical protein
MRKMIFVSLLALSLLAVSMAIGSVAADPVQKTDGFVCPVLGGQAGQNGMHVGVTPIAGGYFTHGGPDVSVPSNVPNQGFPSQAGSFLIPGEVGYNAIWDYANAP